MQIQIYKYEDENRLSNIRTAEIDNEIWFVAYDVCEVLNLVQSDLDELDDDERLKELIPTIDNTKQINLISESGLYTLIFKSKKDNAKTFKKWVTKEVLPTIRKTGIYSINRAEVPNFVRRYNDNWHRVERGHFSVISELFVILYGRFEQLGYEIPNKAFNGKEMRPDGSVGKRFSTYLKDKHPDKKDEYKLYKHYLNPNLVVDARQYKLEMLPIFREYVENIWLTEFAYDYFKERDLKALDYLPKMLNQNTDKRLN